MKANPKHILTLSILLLLLGLTGTVFAQGSDPTDDEVNAIARQLYCPVCENIPLDACGTAACEQWRGIIREKLSEGWTEDQIKNYFVEQYGDRVLAEPPRRGFNWLVYLIPILALAAGIVLLVLGFRKWRQAGEERRPQRKPPRPVKDAVADETYLKKVEDELQARSESKK